jgi:predicted alpha/beta superfamily hydrolase
VTSGSAVSSGFAAAIGEHRRIMVAGRNVDVLLPPGPADVARPLLLAHDGQNVFEPGFSFGGVPWGVDVALKALVDCDIINEAQMPMVIAPWNRDGFGRAADYAPERFVRANPQALAGFEEFYDRIDWCGDEYVRWCADDLLPLANNFGYEIDPHNIAVMGSSMGGLASAYALALRPDIYSTALCLSTHWPPGGHELVRQMIDALPNPQIGARMWFDHGDQGLDASYGEFQATADARMRERGYVEGSQWHSEFFPGTDHNEQSWAARLPQVLAWWLDGSSERAVKWD